jgi:hypothetical protein
MRLSLRGALHPLGAHGAKGESQMHRDRGAEILRDKGREIARGTGHSYSGQGQALGGGQKLTPPAPPLPFPPRGGAGGWGTGQAGWGQDDSEGQELGRGGAEVASPVPALPSSRPDHALLS